MSTAAFHPAHPSPAKRRAVVLGASLSGLLAARGLSEHFDEVVLLERDELPAGAALRKGTPHAVYPHGLLTRGRQVLEEPFPGFTQALVDQGGLLGDLQADVVFEASRRQRRRAGPGRQPAGDRGRGAAARACAARQARPRAGAAAWASLAALALGGRRALPCRPNGNRYLAVGWTRRLSGAQEGRRRGRRGGDASAGGDDCGSPAAYRYRVGIDPHPGRRRNAYHL